MVVGDDDVAGGVVDMVVVVDIDRHVARDLGAEQFQVGRVAQHRLRMPGAADMVVDANHLVGRCHHQMEVVGDHQDAAAAAVAKPGDQPVEAGLAADIDALDGLVEDQQLGVAHQRPGEQDALELAAGNPLHRRIDDMADAGLGEGRFDRAATAAAAEGEEAGDAERHDRVDMQALSQWRGYTSLCDSFIR